MLKRRLNGLGLVLAPMLAFTSPATAAYVSARDQLESAQAVAAAHLVDCGASPAAAQLAADVAFHPTLIAGLHGGAGLGSRPPGEAAGGPAGLPGPEEAISALLFAQADPVPEPVTGEPEVLTTTRVVGINPWGVFLVVLPVAIAAAVLLAAGEGGGTVLGGAAVVGVIMVLFADPGFIFGSGGD